MLKLICLLTIALSICCGVWSSTKPLWPLPESVSLGSTQISLDQSFRFYQMNADNAVSTRLTKAILRYEDRISQHNDGLNTKRKNDGFKSFGSGTKSCKITVSTVYADADEELNTLDFDVDESYSIELTESSCVIDAATVWGGLNALETFIQLLQVDESSNSVVCPYAPVSISDSPRYSHRGLLIDTSRHYLPLQTIYSLISSLPMSKINVLHWHIVDAEAFPFDSTTEPTMVLGAYDSSMIYTMEEISAVTSFAADRGIRVIFEVDVPGHAGGWADGKPSIMANCMQKYTNVENYALNPSLDDTYTTINGILADLVSAQLPYRSKYIHLGGDEVVYGCWSNDATITSFMVTQGITSYDDLLSYFVNRTDTMVQSSFVADVDTNTPISVIHWEEVFFAGATVPDDTIFQVWTDSSQMALVADGGHKILASPSDYWYLNYVKIDWQTMYSYDPNTNLTSSQQKLIIGGEAAVWGELVDGSNLEATVYPRLSAVGERLWSPATVTDLTDAKARLTIQRCRLIQQGYKSAAVQPDYCSIQYI